MPTPKAHSAGLRISRVRAPIRGTRDSPLLILLSSCPYWYFPCAEKPPFRCQTGKLSYHFRRIFARFRQLLRYQNVSATRRTISSPCRQYSLHDQSIFQRIRVIVAPFADHGEAEASV